MPPVLFTQKRKEVGKMRKTNVRKLAVASVFCAVAVVEACFPSRFSEANARRYSIW